MAIWHQVNKKRGGVLCFLTKQLIFFFVEFIDYGFSFVDSDWSFRGPLLLQVAFALILAIGTLALPESPRFLVSKDRDEIALKTLADMHGKPKDNPDVLEEFDQIKSTLELEAKLGEPTWGEMFTRYTKRSFIGIAVQSLGQLCGINIVTVSLFSSSLYDTHSHLIPCNSTTLQRCMKLCLALVIELSCLLASLHLFISVVLSFHPFL